MKERNLLTPPNSEELRSLYLDLLKRSLCDLIYPENELRIMYALHCASQKKRVDNNKLMNIRHFLNKEYQELIKCRREGKRTAHHFSYTMIGLKRLENIQECAVTIFQNNVAGDFVETGVWRGGACIFMRALLKVYGQEHRTIWAADSFEGLPAPELVEDAGLDFHKIDSLSIGLETVKENFRAYSLLDNRVKFIKGWFDETLRDAPIEKIALLRLDGDLYKSTMDAIEALYDKVSVGGYIIVDDYHDIEACRRAVHDFRDKRGINDPIIPIDWTGVFWKKSGSASENDKTKGSRGLNDQGETFFENGRLDEAIDLFLKAIEIDPANVMATNNLGVSYWQKGQVQDALSCFTKAFEMDSDNRDTVVNLIEVLSTLKYFEEANTIGQAYLGRHPEDYEIRKFIRDS